jgi:putative salt-induced outer membrane protein YdiY
MKRIAIVLLTATMVFANVNVEKLRLNLDKSNFGGSVGLEMDFFSGNTKYSSLSFEPDIIWRTGKHTILWLNDLSWKRLDSKDISNRGFSHLRYNFKISELLVWEVFGQAEFNRIIDIDTRYLAGTGARILAIEREKTAATFGIGGMFEYEELTDGSTSNKFRGNSYINFFTTIREGLTFSNILYFQPALENLKDFHLNDEMEISVLLLGGLSLKSGIVLSYDSRPPEGIENHDLCIENGFSYSF